MDKANIVVEVVYALADKQKLLSLSVPVGTTVREAALRSGLDAHFPGLDLHTAPLGIFGKAVAKPDSWYAEMAKKVYRPDVYAIAAKELIAEGKMKASDFPDFAKESGYKPADSNFIDGVSYDGHKPNDYLKQFAIGLKGDQKL